MQFLHHPSRRQLGIIDPRTLKSLTAEKVMDTKQLMFEF